MGDAHEVESMTFAFDAASPTARANSTTHASTSARGAENNDGNGEAQSTASTPPHPDTAVPGTFSGRSAGSSRSYWGKLSKNVQEEQKKVKFVQALHENVQVRAIAVKDKNDKIAHKLLHVAGKKFTPYRKTVIVSTLEAMVARVWWYRTRGGAARTISTRRIDRSGYQSACTHSRRSCEGSGWSAMMRGRHKAEPVTRVTSQSVALQVQNASVPRAISTDLRIPSSLSELISRR